MKNRVGVLCVALLLASIRLHAQIQASFSVPMLGYAFDSTHGQIRPVLGIPGSARFGDPVDLGGSVTQAAFLPGQPYALVSSDGAPEMLVVGLAPGAAAPQALGGVARNPSRMSVSPKGTAAAFYYASTRQVLVVRGLPNESAISGSFDLPDADASVGNMAVNDEGTAVLVPVSGEKQDLLFRWTPSVPVSIASSASRISAIAFFGNDAIVADRGAEEVFAVRDVAGSAAHVFLAGALDGIAQPLGVAVSPRSEIYVANAGNNTVTVFSSSGSVLRTRSCDCSLTGMQSLGGSIFRLTERLDSPVFLLDASSTADRVSFVPALRSPETESLAAAQ